MNTRIRIGALISVAVLLTGTPAIAANNGAGKGQASDTATATSHGKSATAKGKTVRLEVTLTGTIADTPTATASPIHVLVKTVPAAARKMLATGLRGSTISVVVASPSLIRRNGVVATAFTDLKGGDHVSIKLKATSTGTPAVWTYTASRVRASGK